MPCTAGLVEDTYLFAIQEVRLSIMHLSGKYIRGLCEEPALQLHTLMEPDGSSLVKHQQRWGELPNDEQSNEVREDGKAKVL